MGLPTPPTCQEPFSLGPKSLRNGLSPQARVLRGTWKRCASISRPTSQGCSPGADGGRRAPPSHGRKQGRVRGSCRGLAGPFLFFLLGTPICSRAAQDTAGGLSQLLQGGREGLTPLEVPQAPASAYARECGEVMGRVGDAVGTGRPAGQGVGRGQTGPGLPSAPHSLPLSTSLSCPTPDPQRTVPGSGCGVGTGEERDGGGR